MCLPIFLDRLKNEITRLTTVKALTKIAASPLRIDLRPIMVIFLFFFSFFCTNCDYCQVLDNFIIGFSQFKF